MPCCDATKAAPTSPHKSLRALAAWRRDWRTDTSAEAKRRWSFIDERAVRAIENGWKYLESHQQDDGSFIPLWFGNEHQPDETNPVYGTAQVLFASAELDRLESNLSQRAARWLLASQHSNGGWGPPRVPVDYSGAETGRLANLARQRRDGQVLHASKKHRWPLAHSSPWPIRIRPFPKPSPAASRGSPPRWNKTPTGGPQSSVSR